MATLLPALTVVDSAGGTSVASLDLKGQVAALKAQVAANRVALEAKIDRNHNTVIDWINKLNERQGMLEGEQARGWHSHQRLSSPISGASG